MKIICVGRNYAQHAKELKNEVPKEPVIFCKPDSALLHHKKPFFLPDFSKDVHYEAELVIKINRIGKHIQSKFAHKYFNEIGLGIDFTARDIQTELKAKSLPWEKAKGFDGSAIIGEFLPIASISDPTNIDFELYKNGTQVQNGNSSDMLFSFASIIEYVSQYFTLKIGDLIFTGTPAGVGPTQVNDEFKGFIEKKEVLALRVK